MAERAVLDLDRRRGLVPSARLATRAVPEPEADGEVEVGWGDEAPALDLRGAFRDQLAALRPREVLAGGAALPMVALLLYTFVYQSDQAAFVLLGPHIQADLGIGLAAIGGIVTATIWVGAVLTPLYGFLVDRVKRVWLLRAGSLFGSLGLLFAGTASGAGSLTLARISSGMAQRMNEPVVLPLVADYYPPRTRMRFFAFQSAAGSLASVLAPLAAGALAVATSWRVPLLLIGAMSLACLALICLLREPVRGGQDRLAAGAAAEVAAKEQRPLTWAESWRALMAVKSFRRIMYSWPFAVTGINGIGGFLVNLWLANHWHLDDFQRAVLLAGVSAVMVPMLVASGPIGDRLIAINPGRVLGLIGGVQILSGLAVVAIIASPSLPLAVVMLIFVQAAGSLVGPSLFGVTSLVVPPRIRGFGMSMFGLFLLVGAPIFPFILGVADSAGYLAGAVVIVPIISISAAFMFSAAGAVGSDIRAMLAASMADADARKAREEGCSKLLVCRDVDVSYDGSPVLCNVDFDLEDGEMVALLGTNGAGKSTLLRAIVGIQQCSNGAIFLDGDDITHLPPDQVVRRGVVMMPGGRAVFPTLTVAENLASAEWLSRNVSAEVRAARREEALRLFPRLSERMTTRAGDLSGGEQQMLALSQALMMEPRLLLIDELSLGLAPNVVADLLDVVRRIHANGTTVVIVEQSVNVALQLAHRAVFMENGRVRFDGSLDELYARGDIVRAVFLEAGAGTLGGTRVAGGAVMDEREQPALEVHNLHVSHGGVHAVDGVGLVVMPGEVVGVVGPNGAGKTTLFDAITGFVEVASGSIVLDGIDVTAMAPHQRARLALARSYQNVRLFSALTVRDNIAVALDRHLANRSVLSSALWLPFTRRSERRASRRIDNLIATLHLEAYQNSFLSELSTGTRRIVDIACQIAAGPKLLLLDEPSSGLAQAEVEALGTTIQRIRKETGCGILVVEHDLALISQVSDRLIALELGHVVRDGAPADVLADPDVRAMLMGGADGAGAAVAARSGRRVGAPA